MKLVCEHEGETRTLATEVETADTLLAQMRGLMFRRSIPEEYALLFRFDQVGSRDVHMLFVPFPLDVLWVIDGEVKRKERLSPWTGLAKAEADLLIELPAGSADGVEAGDEISIVY